MYQEFGTKLNKLWQNLSETSQKHKGGLTALAWEDAKEDWWDKIREFGHFSGTVRKACWVG